MKTQKKSDGHFLSRVSSKVINEDAANHWFDKDWWSCETIMVIASTQLKLLEAFRV